MQMLKRLVILLLLFHFLSILNVLYNVTVCYLNSVNQNLKNYEIETEYSTTLVSSQASIVPWDFIANSRQSDCDAPLPIARVKILFS